MREEKQLVDKYGREGGWKVPEGYFEAMRVEVESKLPPYPAPPQAERLTLWRRLSPYICLAAMFMGIWLMMKVFHNASSIDSLSIENPPEQIAAYMGDPEVSAPYLVSESYEDAELMDEVSGNYDSIEAFEKDFGYQLQPEYDNIDL